jgi:hypothetical protein
MSAPEILGHSRGTPEAPPQLSFTLPPFIGVEPIYRFLPMIWFSQSPFVSWQSAFDWPFGIPLGLCTSPLMKTVIWSSLVVSNTILGRVLRMPKRQPCRRAEPTLMISPDALASTNVQELLDNAIVPALVDEFLKRRVHNRKDL